MTGIPSDLLAAYRAAIYEIDVDAEHTIQFRVAETNPALDEILSARGADRGVLITAYNPRSRQKTAAENAAAHRALLDEAARLGNAFLSTRGRDPDGRWPAEPGLFILQLGEEQARALAQAFDQYAYISVRAGAAPQLICIA